MYQQIVKRNPIIFLALLIPNYTSGMTTLDDKQKSILEELKNATTREVVHVLDSGIQQNINFVEVRDVITPFFPFHTPEKMEAIVTHKLTPKIKNSGQRLLSIILTHKHNPQFNRLPRELLFLILSYLPEDIWNGSFPTEMLCYRSWFIDFETQRRLNNAKELFASPELKKALKSIYNNYNSLWALVESQAIDPNQLNPNKVEEHWGQIIKKQVTAEFENNIKKKEKDLKNLAKDSGNGTTN